MTAADEPTTDRDQIMADTIAPEIDDADEITDAPAPAPQGEAELDETESSAP